MSCFTVQTNLPEADGALDWAQFAFAWCVTIAACALAWTRWINRPDFRPAQRSATREWAETNLRLPRTRTFNRSVGRHRK